MMQRLLTVTTGYLKFAFISITAATLVFSSTALAISSPRSFIIVAALALLAFFAIRSEWTARRHQREIAQLPDDPSLVKESLLQWMTFAEATNILASSLAEVTPLEATALWVFEWDHLYDPKSIPDLNSPKLREKALISSVLTSLSRHQTRLASLGLHPIFVSKAPASEIVDSLNRRTFPKLPVRIAVKNESSTRAAYQVSIAFVQDQTAASLRPETVVEELSSSFRVIRGRVIRLLPSEPKAESTPS